MSVSARLTKVFQTAEQIPYDKNSRIVLMSDCHRGDGSWSDNFLSNQNLFFAALTYYYQKNFTYIELGDGDELWENRKLSDIINVHSDAFWLMSKYYKKGRLYMLYGNHDMVKKNKNYVKKNYTSYYSESDKKQVRLFPNIKIHEGLVLYNKDTNNKIFLIHGHQVDFLNYNLWKLARFLVRYVWRPFELLGMHDPTSTAENNIKKGAVEKKMIDWSLEHNQMIVAGHTHRPVFPQIGEPLYFNDGSCVHPRCITAIEIQDNTVSLVKWTVKTDKSRFLYVGRDVLEGPITIDDYQRTNKNLDNK